MCFGKLISPFHTKAPTDAVNRMGQVLQSFGANCLKEKTLPTMEFELGSLVFQTAEPLENFPAPFSVGVPRKNPKKMVKISHPLVTDLNYLADSDLEGAGLCLAGDLCIFYILLQW